ETNASVDSELSMVLFGNYELYLWQMNELKDNLLWLFSKTLMVSRLDGPSFKIAKGLVDKAIMAEKTGLKGIAYIDSRGIADDKKPYSYGNFDQSLRNLAVIIRLRTNMPVKEERTEKLFGPGACPQTAIYCGWYSLKKYVDAFDFVDGAVGYHISSLEAVDLRDPNSTQWCPAMLKHGITATIGAVAEPYLHSFPQPKEFFLELFSGSCLVEAYYHTNPFNSWQLVLIGDPMYTPFQKSQKALGLRFLSGTSSK
ncbi:MAG: TIGR03790 family protein, partial [Sedimentisphaerales bacterium]